MSKLLIQFNVLVVALVMLASVPTVADSCMVTPTPGQVVSGRFGKFREGGASNSGSANKNPHMHDGLDFSTSGASVPLVATTNGTITFIGNRGTAGNTILIQRGNGDVVGYYHLSAFTPGLQQGSTVTAGQSLGLSGNTPTATMAKHLHFVYGTAAKDSVRATSFSANAAKGAFNPGQLPNVFKQQSGIGWKTDPTMYFCQTYPIQDGHPADAAVLGADTYAQHNILFANGSVPNNVSFDAQQVIAANADAALAAAEGKPTKDFISDKQGYGTLPTAPIGGYETMSTSEMMLTEATRRFVDADWNTNITILDKRGLMVDYVRMMGVSNFIANATLQKKEKVEALLAVYTSLKLKAARGATAQARKRIEAQQIANKIQN